jgi:hypothetical protein
MSKEISLASAIVDSELPPSSRSRSKPPPLPDEATRIPPDRAAADAAFADGMLERLACGDYFGALLSAEALLETLPLHRDALDTAQIARSELRRLYAARLGSLDHVPCVAVGQGALFSMQRVDFRAGLLLARVNGRATLRQIVDESGMPAHEALRVLSELYLHRVIAFA